MAGSGELVSLSFPTSPSSSGGTFQDRAGQTECLTYDTCEAGEYVSKTGTATSNREVLWAMWAGLVLQLTT